MASKIPRISFAAVPDPMNPKLRPIESTPLVNPALVGTTSPAQRAMIGLTRVVSPESVRRDQMDQMQAAVDTVNAYIRSNQADYAIRFEMHQRSGITYALIRNAETGQVLKQIPSETMLNIAARVKQASGIFVDLST